MADSNASFIPKNTQRIQKRVRTTYRIYLLSYLSYVFFFGTLIAVIGTYLYAVQVNNGLKAIKTDFDTARQVFSESDIEGVRQLEKRLLTADQLLSQSAAPSRVFEEVEKIVAENIQFIRFSYEALPNQKAMLSLTGKAEDFNQILYQRDLMNGSLLFEAAPDLQFDYAAAPPEEEEDGTPIEAPVGGETTLTFIVSNEISTSLIPYQPQAVDSANLVTEVRSVEVDSSQEAIESAPSDVDGVEVNEASI